MKAKNKLEKINDQITEQALHLHNVSGSVCDHKVRTPDGMVMTFRNVCEVCGADMRPPVKDMKVQILKVAQDLEKGTIDSDKARSLLLGLFGVSGSLQPLTINNVSKMLDKVSKETWIAVQGDEHGWKEWWKNKNKVYLNSNDH